MNYDIMNFFITFLITGAPMWFVLIGAYVLFNVFSDDKSKMTDIKRERLENAEKRTKLLFYVGFAVSLMIAGYHAIQPIKRSPISNIEKQQVEYAIEQEKAEKFDKAIKQELKPLKNLVPEIKSDTSMIQDKINQYEHSK